MAELRKETSQEMGLHEEQLKGRTQKKFFSIDESENLTYFHSFDVDTSKTATIDALDMTPREINREIRELMEKGIGDITVDNPMSRHGVGVGILNRLNLTFSDSLGYFGCGLIDGPNVHIKGRVGWSCAENMMAGTVVIDKNAGSTFGAAIRGGDLVCKGSVGARTGIDQKGGTIIVGGKTGAFSGFMMQRGRMIVLGDAGMNLGDSMYDGTIYVGGEVEELGVDCVQGDMTELDVRYLTEKLALYGMKSPRGVEKMQKHVSGKMLWNYANL
jgi:glutamate synthase domain-containing protein 3